MRVEMVSTMYVDLEQTQEDLLRNNRKVGGGGEKRTTGQRHCLPALVTCKHVWNAVQKTSYKSEELNVIYAKKFRLNFKFLQ